MPARPSSRRRRRWPAFLAGVVVGDALTVAVAWLYPILLPIVTSWAEPLLGPASVSPRPEPPAAVAAARPSIPAAPAAGPASAAPPAPAARPPKLDGPPPDDWGGPKVAMLPSDLGQMGPSVKLALDRVRNEDMAFCFKSAEPEVPRRAADVMLFLETRDGAVDVVDARLARPGALPADVLQCCLEVLRGLEIKAFFVVPGQRYRYLHEIEE